MKSQIALFGAALSMASLQPCLAGPCSSQIDAMQGRIDAKLSALAAAGPAGSESVAATDSHQPTPKTIAEAEVKLGDVSAKLVDNVAEAMTRARTADVAGDSVACEEALAVVRKALDN